MKKIKIKKQSIDVLFVLIMMISIAFIYNKSYYMLYINILIMWGLTLYICCTKFEKYIFIFFFLIMMYFFILGKPIASIIIKVGFWNRASNEGFIFALKLIYISLAGIYTGCSIMYSKEYTYKNFSYEKDFYKILQKISYYMFIVSFALDMYRGLYQIIFFKVLNHNYLEYYNGSYTTDSLPIIVKIGGQMLVPSMCVFLATTPKKEKGKRVLLMYFISTLPLLIVGSRGAAMSALVYYISYCIFRNYIDGENWFNIKNFKWIILSTPLLMGLLVVYTEIRNGIIIKERILEKLMHPISWFLYELGQSFDLLLQFFTVKDKLPSVGFPGYFFGYIYDCITQNKIISTIFNIKTYTPYTVEWLKASKSMARYLSYYILGESSFIAGNNTDSVFVIDAYIQFGIVGVFVTSFLLAIYMLQLENWIRGNWFKSAIALYSLLFAFQLPRSMYMVLFGFLFTPYFWITIAIIYISSNLYYHQKMRK